MIRDAYYGALYGLAVGDALGAQVEFAARGSFPLVTEMLGGGPHGLEPGQWTDDTSMALALAESLVERNGFDAHDQMQRYLSWYHDGTYSSTGECFDIGRTTQDALATFERTGKFPPLVSDETKRLDGNGGLMRLAPVVMWFYPSSEYAALYARLATAVTHNTPVCLDASELFSRQLFAALEGQPKDRVLLGGHPSIVRHLDPRVAALAQDAAAYAAIPETDIRSGGYVLDTLKAALWAFATTETFEDAVVKAVNLGDDADTVGAVCGQLAGAYYGADAIPPRWLTAISKRSYLGLTAEGLYDGERATA